MTFNISLTPSVHLSGVSVAGGCRGCSLSPVLGLVLLLLLVPASASSGRGRSLKLLGGRATWLVEPEYSRRSVCRGVKGRLVSTVRNPVLGSLQIFRYSESMQRTQDSRLDKLYIQSPMIGWNGMKI